MIKVAIHHRENSFSERWIKYCQTNNIPYIIINVFDNDVITHIESEGVTHFMWHINHASSKDLMVFSYVMNSLDEIDVKTFPNFNTRWHFDDKIAQKYLLESIKAPLVPSMVFYDQNQALNHIDTITFPIVAKLKRGAGATNVKLLHDKNQAIDYIQKMFSTGINSNAGAFGNMDAKLRLAKKVKNPIKLIKKVINHISKSSKELKINANERGYFYYQEFMPKNDYDTRVIIVGDKAVAIRRNNREGDFRASGSGKIEYDINLIDINTVKIAFQVSNKVETQSLAFDFVYDNNKQLKIIEVCFGFSMLAYDKCPGYWDSNLKYHNETLNLQYEMMKCFLKE